MNSDESDTDYLSSGEENIPIISKLKAANSNNSPTGSKRRRKLTWRVIGFTQCSKTCGGGKLMKDLIKYIFKINLSRFLDFPGFKIHKFPGLKLLRFSWIQLN